jgi:RNase adapter protein RapZ
MPERPRLVIITGMAGAGRSHASKALEDLGYFVIDNLPADLISHVVARADLPESAHTRLAVVVDTRGGLDFDELDLVMRQLAAEGVPTTTVFLEADDDVLVQRFEESRRPHPVPSETLADSISDERAALAGVHANADLMIDTSEMNVHELRELVTASFAKGVEQRAMRVAVTSFGFKHGVPRIIDLAFDVRFLPNPHWVEELRPLTGLDAAVSEHVLAQDDAQAFMTKIEDLMTFLVPRYQTEGKSYLTVGIGCTGGRHRSVAIAEHLAEFLMGLADIEVTVRHRDISR